MSMKAQILFLFSIYYFLIGRPPPPKTLPGLPYLTNKVYSIQQTKNKPTGGTKPYIRTGKDLSG